MAEASSPGLTGLLLDTLQRGAADAATLCRVLGVSQPTLSRQLRAAGVAVVRTGQARSTRYLASRAIDGQRVLPLFRVTPAGQVQQWGELLPVYPNPHVLVRFTDGSADELFEGLPWWLQDMRPQGFLGRTWVQRRAVPLGLPADLTTWDDNHVLRALAAGEQDNIGNLLLGEAARTAWLARPDGEVVQMAARATRYPQLASLVLAGEPVGSSAAGEQPKFACTLRDGDAADAWQQPVLVKFSVAADTSSTQRWRDLLLAEHHALETLRAHGLPAAESNVLDTPEQRFLQLTRFDRLGAAGRCGLISLAALEAGVIGQAQHAWPELTRQLAANGYITAQAAEQAAQFYAFGRLIGNCDMHHGNIAFLHHGQLPLPLAPCYDMLPMALAPDRNGLMRDELPPLIVPSQPVPAVWRAMLPLARAYWRNVAADARFSAGFIAIAAAQSGWLDQIENQLSRLI
ncbi:type II toxin-antitoxin system HipA family toxin YjjJ [Amantichitinum ursilacus]|uniref:Putative DNA-binding transcriptional regulator n=1 Tax=Amantichitinum ursilacus TaxID=857265 RepID=A0A0N1JSC5_9NEIS|nr:type II toxin-antitoxin system HipA family toxin YjjJ [Amantichitinum ursilacus]KPC52641.1 putative DNA-binding transcriptional regulator [Amantichitinum ursilacus]